MCVCVYVCVWVCVGECVCANVCVSACIMYKYHVILELVAPLY